MEAVLPDDIANILRIKLLSPSEETYGIKHVIRAADHITNVLKIDLECRSGATAVSLSAGYQETAAYCRIGWEPYRKKIARTSNGESSGDSSKCQPILNVVIARAAVGRDTPCLLIFTWCGSALARVLSGHVCPIDLSWCSTYTSSIPQRVTTITLRDAHIVVHFKNLLHERT